MFSRGRSLHQPWRWRSQGSSIARGMVAGMGGTKERPGCGNIADMSDELTAGVEGGAHATPVKLSMTRKRKREDVEWKATLNEWGRATGDGNGSDDDRFGLFDHALPSQKEVIADAEEEGDRGTGFAHVSLVGALAGERYCFPGVGNPPDFLVPVQRYQAQDIMNSYLVRLLRIQEGWAIHRNAETRDPTLSPSPVTAFIGKDDRPYQYGCLAKIANEEGTVFVMFGDTPLPVSFEEKECGDLDDVETPRSDTERSLPVSFEEKECGDLDDVQTPRSDTERFN